jgi:hypothetical protein
LRDQFAETLKRRLTGELTDRDSTQEEIVKALRQQLSEQEVTHLQEILKDYRPGQDQ